jgi:hypothetical protein
MSPDLAFEAAKVNDLNEEDSDNPLLPLLPLEDT